MLWWEWVPVIVDGAAATAFVLLGRASRRRSLIGVGGVLLVAAGLMVSAIVLSREDLAYGSYALGWPTCLVGLFLLSHPPRR